MKHARPCGHGARLTALSTQHAGLTHRSLRVAAEWVDRRCGGAGAQVARGVVRCCARSRCEIGAHRHRRRPRRVLHVGPLQGAPARTTMLLADDNAWQTCTVGTQVGIVAALDVWRDSCNPNQCDEHTSAATISGPLVRSRMSVDTTRSTEHRAGSQGGNGGVRERVDSHLFSAALLLSTRQVVASRARRA